jgi:cytochrome c553
MKRTLLVMLLAALATGRAAADADADAGLAFFEAKIRPVLVEHCYRCHGEKKQRGNLRLDSKDAMLKGGDSGPALVVGKAAESLLIKAIRHDGELKMPEGNKLPANVMADFEKWVAMGAPDPRTVGAAAVAETINWNAARTFWSFQQPHKPAEPKVRNAGWARTPIDRFILAKLEAEGLHPVAPASRQALIRRATFDLIGLPPTPEEVEAFTNDPSPDAFTAVVDRLLASPHYGERWGRYWLDVARYAEDQAHTFAVVPNTNAYRYRDWVVAALNDDMPYDRFLKLQVAADLIEKDDAGRIKHLPALGFFGLGAQYYKNTDAAKAAADELDDRVDTVTRAMLGLTVSCARCHDHKFDPIPQQDYYSLAGIFSSSKLANVMLATRAEETRYIEQQGRIKKVDTELKQFLRVEKAALAEKHAVEVARYAVAAWKVQVRREAKMSVGAMAKKESLEAGALGRWVKFMEKPPKSAAADAWLKLSNSDEAKAAELAEKLQQTVNQCLADRGKKPLSKANTDLLDSLFGEKGVFTPTDGELNSQLPADKKQRLEQMKTDLTKLQMDDAARPLPVAHGLAEANAADMKVFLRGNPAKLGPVAPRRFLQVLAGENAPRFSQGSGRLELANAIATKDNPLTARVMVNRVWQNHFGRGLVATPSNFGKLGERPTHPELLDYLACRLVDSGWSLKTLHREIMLSAVYQLASVRDESNFAIDTDNRFLWRMNRRRLDIEAWRDAMLAVSGKLDATMGGPTMELSAANNFRRTMYAKISRHDLNQLLRLFDFPDANITSERRNETTVPQQQLFVFNSPFVAEAAKALAARVQQDARGDDQRVQRAIQLAYGRCGSDEELSLAVGFLHTGDSASEQQANRLTRWERLAQVLIGSNEFMYVD